MFFIFIIRKLLWLAVLTSSGCVSVKMTRGSYFNMRIDYITSL